MDCWFSDITVLHNHLNTMGYKTIHGIMPITYPRATAEAIENGFIWEPYVTKLP
jgi:muramoyltetrapeptide carboxypeptidase LdcA involved in peptidoglycan recycling